MSQSSRYETMLGQLGAYLACQEARRVEIADEGAFISVSWQAPGAGRRHRHLREDEIERLRPSSQRAQDDSASRAALLGLLGRRLDQTGVDVARIEERTEAFQISGATSGRYSCQRVAYWELRGPDGRKAETAGETESSAPAELPSTSSAPPFRTPEVNVIQDIAATAGPIVAEAPVLMDALLPTGSGAAAPPFLAAAPLAAIPVVAQAEPMPERNAVSTDLPASRDASQQAPIAAAAREGKRDRSRSRNSDTVTVALPRESVAPTGAPLRRRLQLY